MFLYSNFKLSNGLYLYPTEIILPQPTRLYVSSTIQVGGVTPAFTGWTITTGADRRLLSESKGTSALTTKTSSATYSSSQGVVNRLSRQAISNPLVAQTISGTFKAQFKCREGAGETNHASQIRIRVVSNNGTVVRGTLFDFYSYSLVSEFTTNATVQNRKWPRSDLIGTLTPVACQNDDRIVVEIGSTSNYTDPMTGLIGNWAVQYGENGNDLGENETDTGALAGWIEFSQQLIFQSA